MTVKEHDYRLAEALKSAPEVAKQLKIANSIEVLKALHQTGELSDEEFANHMTEIGRIIGFVK